jgi:hypothetical protein
LRNRRPDESIIFAKVVFVAWFSSFMRTRGSGGYEDCCRGDIENALDPEPGCDVLMADGRARCGDRPTAVICGRRHL